MRPSLPPGPRAPALWQTLHWQARPVSFFERLGARYGKRFTIRLLATPPMVMICDPAEVKEVFTASPEVLHPGRGANILEPIVGRYSVILLDERDHLEQRKLMLPAFHGERVERLSAVMEEVAAREVASWPRGEPIELHPRLQALTLEIILRAVFGLEEGQRLDAVRSKLSAMIELGTKPFAALPLLHRDLGPLTSWARFARLREETTALLHELIDERRAAEEERDDVLSLLLAARHEDGSPMSNDELRDELMTLLVAGHETTASELAWAFERLVREPRVLAELVSEIRAEDGDAYLTATIQETLRRRPVLPNNAPRLTTQPVEIGGWLYPKGVSLSPNAYLIHHDPEIYPDPYAFRPERFLDESPGTYTWIPFGGGRRRCLGASFAQVEMKVVLRSVLGGDDVRAADQARELTRRRSITWGPRRGALAVLSRAEAEAGNGTRQSAASPPHPTSITPAPASA